MPVYFRLQDIKIGHTPGAKQAWSDYIGKYIAPLAEQMGGPVTAGGPQLVERAKKFNTTTWAHLMDIGMAGSGTGPLGWASPPTSTDAQGGYLYRAAMQSTDPEFQKEFKAMVAADPSFISGLFQPGR